MTTRGTQRAVASTVRDGERVVRSRRHSGASKQTQLARPAIHRSVSPLAVRPVPFLGGRTPCPVVLPLMPRTTGAGGGDTAGLTRYAEAWPVHRAVRSQRRQYGCPLLGHGRQTCHRCQRYWHWQRCFTGRGDARPPAPTPHDRQRPAYPERRDTPSPRPTDNGSGTGSGDRCGVRGVSAENARVDETAVSLSPSTLARLFRSYSR